MAGIDSVSFIMMIVAMLAVVVIIALIGYLLDKGLVLARNRLIYWEKLDTYYV